ncbi:hypothetical protein, partial [Salmonella sp. 2019-SM259]|uniref:hypothetical protein n=1 Tax=Salmonella sp. 2019-SM259 TaxID=3068194 RepID=UPI00377017DD
TRGVDIRNLSDYKDDDWIRLPPFVAQLLPELVWHLGLPAANYFKDKNGITLPAFQGVTVEGFFYRSV